MKTNQTRQQPGAATHQQGGYSRNPIQLLQNKKPADNPFQLLQKEAATQPGFNPIQLIVESQTRVPKGSSNAPVVQKYGVHVVTDAASSQDDVIQGITFKGRPGGTFIGGDPHGTQRHVISIQLEQKAVQALYVGKTIGQAAHTLGCNPTAADVSEAIKATLSGQDLKSRRLIYQGSGTSNSALQNVTAFAESEMRKYHPDAPTHDPEKYRQAVLLAFAGTFDSPPQEVKQNNRPEIFGAIELHRWTIQRAYNIPDHFMPGQKIITDLFSTKSSDEIAQFAEGIVSSLRVGASADKASHFGHFKLDAPPSRQQPLYSLDSAVHYQPPTGQIAGPSYPQQQLGPLNNQYSYNPHQPGQQQILPSISTLLSLPAYRAPQQQGHYQQVPPDYQLQPHTPTQTPQYPYYNNRY